MAPLIPPVASTSTRSIRTSFSGSQRMTPSVAAVVVHSTGTLSVAPDGSVNVRSTHGVSVDVAAGAAIPDVPGDPMAPEGGAAQPDTTATVRGIKTPKQNKGRSIACRRITFPPTRIR